MTRPSTRAVRRAAADLSDQMSPHLASAKDTLVTDVVPKVRSTGAAVRPMAAGVLPKAKAAGVGVAVRAGLMEAPKNRHPVRMALIAGGLAVGAYAAWNAWRLPHASDDWAHAAGTTGDGPPDDQKAGGPADTRVAF